MKIPLPKPALVALVVVLFSALSAAAAVEAPAAPAVPAAPNPAPAASPALQPAPPLPLFLTDTYLCSYDIDDPCTGEVVTTCSKVCNVGQNCHCAVQYAPGIDGCAYVKNVSPPFCF